MGIRLLLCIFQEFFIVEKMFTIRIQNAFFSLVIHHYTLESQNPGPLIFSFECVLFVWTDEYLETISTFSRENDGLFFFGVPVCNFTCIVLNVKKFNTTTALYFFCARHTILNYHMNLTQPKNLQCLPHNSKFFYSWTPQ